MNKIAEKINTLIDTFKDLCKEIKIGFKKFTGIFKQIKWLDIPAATYVRWILAFIVCLNTVLNHLGLNPISISENTIYQIISAVLSAAVLIVNTYKNNSTSKEALLSDKIMHALKDANTDDEDIMIEKLEGILVELKHEDENIVRDHSNNAIEDTLEPVPETSEESEVVTEEIPENTEESDGDFCVEPVEDITVVYETEEPETITEEVPENEITEVVESVEVESEIQSESVNAEEIQ